MRIDPWASQQSTDYQRLRDEFGIAAFDPDLLPEASPLMERGVIFGQRGFEPVATAIRRVDPWGVMTGLMPSGPMHFGHKLVLDQCLFYQQLGADMTITIADIEAYVTRGMPLQKARDIAIENYVKNYLAMGLDPVTTQIYFQSKRTAVKDLSWKLGRKVNFSAMQSIYGFGGETNMGHMVAPLVQVGDILHVQLPEHGGPRPIVVPVGVDQDPHIRLTRDLAQAHRVFNVQTHDHPKMGPLVAVFVKDVPDNKVESWLNKAKAAIETLGMSDIKLHVKYKALYVPSGSARDIADIDAVLARLEAANGEFGFLPPAATYHRFMQGLTGGKMSSSKPETHIALADDAEEAAKKIGRAKTGGRESAEEQREKGGRAHECMVYETYVYHLVPDQQELKQLYDDCTSGKMLCGECKGIAKEKVRIMIGNLKERRDETEHLVKQVVRED